MTEQKFYIIAFKCIWHVLVVCTYTLNKNVGHHSFTFKINLVILSIKREIVFDDIIMLTAYEDQHQMIFHMITHTCLKPNNPLEELK